MSIRLTKDSIGKFYKTKDGRKAYIDCRLNNPTMMSYGNPYIGTIFAKPTNLKGMGLTTWSETGNTSFEHCCLVSEWEEDLTIEQRLERLEKKLGVL